MSEYSGFIILKLSLNSKINICRAWQINNINRINNGLINRCKLGLVLILINPIDIINLPSPACVNLKILIHKNILTGNFTIGSSGFARICSAKTGIRSVSAFCRGVSKPKIKLMLLQCLPFNICSLFIWIIEKQMCIYPNRKVKFTAFLPDLQWVRCRWRRNFCGSSATYWQPSSWHSTCISAFPIPADWSWNSPF